MIDKLIKIQSELKAPKNQYNNFGKYSYRSAEDILEAVKPLLAKHGLAIILQDEIINVGDRYYIQAKVILHDAEGNTLVTTAQAREEENKKSMDSMQLTGATSSYARKYALNGMFAIDDTKDSDSTNTNTKTNTNKSGAWQKEKQTKPEPTEKLVSKARLAEMKSLAEQVNVLVKIKQECPDLTKMTHKRAGQIMQGLQARLEKER